MNIRIAISLFVFCFLSSVRAMEDFRPSGAQAKKNGKGLGIIIPVAEDRNNTPPLDSGQPRASNSDSGQKRNIDNLTELKKATSQRLTARRNGNGSSATTRNITRSGDSPSSEMNGGGIAVGSPPQKAPSLLPTAMERRYSGKILLQEHEKMYSEDEIWEKLKIFNMPLYTVGKKYHMNIQELEDCAIFLQEHDIDPRVIAEHIRGRSTPQEGTWWQKLLDPFFGNSHEQSFDRLNKHFEEMKRQNPHSYEEMILELMKITSDPMGGIEKRSPIEEAHNTLLREENAHQNAQIRVQYVAIFAQFLATIGAAAWAIYGQVGNAEMGNVTMT